MRSSLQGTSQVPLLKCIAVLAATQASLLAQDIFEGTLTSGRLGQPIACTKANWPTAPDYNPDLPLSLGHDWLDDCNYSGEITTPGWKYAATANGHSRVRINKGPWTPTRAVDTWLRPRGGLVTADVFVSSVISVRPTDDPDYGPSSITLRARGTNLHQFSKASVKVFDHDTNELLLSIDKDDLPVHTETNSSYPPHPEFVFQEINFDDRLGHSLRFEYEVTGEATGGYRSDAYFQAYASMWVPEPSSSSLALFCMLPIAALRKRGRRCV